MGITVESMEWLLLHCFQVELEFRNVGTRRKTLGAGTRTKNKLNPHMTPRPGIEPGPHWWEASHSLLSPLRHPCSHTLEMAHNF